MRALLTQALVALALLCQPVDASAQSAMEIKAKNLAAQAARSVRSIVTGPVIADYATPSKMLIIAHRGGRARQPEDTVKAALWGNSAGIIGTKWDIQGLPKTNARFYMHDTTVDRTTTGTGSLSALDTAGLRALSVDGAKLLGSGYGNEPIPFFNDIASVTRGKQIFIADISNSGYEKEIVDDMKAAGLSPASTIIQAPSLAQATVVANLNSGYPLRLFVGNPGDVTISQAKAIGVSSVSLNASTHSDSDITAWVNSGVAVTMYTINRRYLRDKYAALGVTGLISDDPEYVMANKPFASQDNFVSGQWAAGQFGIDDSSIGATARGRLIGNGWGFNEDAANVPSGVRSLLLGFLCPLLGTDTPGNFDVDFRVTPIAVKSGASSAWFAIFIGSPAMKDQPYTGGVVTGENGWRYRVDMTGGTNGQLRLNRVDDGNLGPSTTQSGTAAVMNTAMIFRLSSRSNGDHTLTRLNTDGTTMGTPVTVNDTTANKRGGYLSFVTSSVSAIVSDVVVSRR